MFVSVLYVPRTTPSENMVQSPTANIPAPAHFRVIAAIELAQRETVGQRYSGMQESPLE